VDGKIRRFVWTVVKEKLNEPELYQKLNGLMNPYTVARVGCHLAIGENFRCDLEHKDDR